MRAPTPLVTAHVWTSRLLLCCALLCAQGCSSSAVKGDGQRAEKPEQFPPFQEVELSHFLEAHFLIAPADEPPRSVSLAVSGDSNLVPAVNLRMVGPRLSLSASPELASAEPILGVVIEGKLTELHRVSLNDTARATIDSARGDQFQIDAFSESDFSLEHAESERVLVDAHDKSVGSAQGFSKQLTLVATDNANIQTHRLKVQSAVIDLSGKAIATVCATDTLEVRLRDDALLVKFCEPQNLLSDIEEDALLRDPTANEKKAATSARIDIKRKRRKPVEEDKK